MKGRRLANRSGLTSRLESGDTRKCAETRCHGTGALGLDYYAKSLVTELVAVGGEWVGVPRDHPALTRGGTRVAGACSSKQGRQERR